MKRLILFLIVFVFVPHLSVRAQEVSLTLEEAVAIALRDNREILLKAEDVKKAKAEIAEAQADLLPALNFTATRSLTTGYYSKDLAQTTTQTTLKEYLYKGGKTTNTIQQNKYKSEVSVALLDKTKLDTVLNVKKAFYTLLLAEEFSNLNKDIIENTKGHLRSIQQRYQNGLAPESDILAIEASLYNVQQAYETSLNQTESSQALLKNLLYLHEAVRIKPEAKFSYEPRETAYDKAFLLAMQNRPEIRQYAAQEKADQKAIEIAKSDNRPNIYASWDYYNRSHIGAAATKDWNDYNIIGLTLTWPIFDGWSTKAKVDEALIDLKKTQLLKEKAVKDIALELKDAYLSLKNAVVKLEASEADLIVYKDNLLTVEEKYSQGQASLLDKDDADLKYKVALFNQKQAIYDYLIAKSSFDTATGGI